MGSEIQMLGGPPSGDYKGRPLEAADYDNRASFITGQKDIAAAGTAEQLGSQAVPNGFRAVIKAKSTNGDDVYIGNSKANAEDGGTHFILQANESIEIRVNNLNLIWVDVGVNGEGIEYILET